MNTDRLWVIAAVAVMAIIAAGGYFLGISPVLSSAVAANQQASTITLANDANVQKLTTLKAQYANLPTLQASLDKLRKSIPVGANASEFLQELNALSAAHNVSLSTVTIASATVYAAPGATSGATAPTTPGSTATPTPTPTATPDATTTTPTTTPVAAGGSFVQVPVVIVATGNFSDVRDFMGAVQTGDRLYLATSVGISEGSSSASGGGSATGTLTGDVFTLQGTSTPEATPTPVVPTPAPTDSATPPSTPTNAPTSTATPGSTKTPTP